MLKLSQCFADAETGLFVAYQAGSKHQQACCDQQVQTKGSKQSLVLENANDPLHCQLLAPEDKFQSGSTCCGGQACDKTCCQCHKKLGQGMACVPAPILVW